jgi:transcription initiation factor TFIID TATA-box-binding protein
MVFTANLGTPLNLRMLARLCHDRVDFNPHKFASAIFRSPYPKTTTLLFSTGCVVITGCRRRWCAAISLNMIIKMLSEIHIPVLYRKTALQNVVGSVDIGEAIDNDYLASQMQEDGSYELGLFPGLVWRPDEKNKATILCFPSGKMVITGCRTEAEIADAQTLVEEIKTASAQRKLSDEPVHKYSRRIPLG